MIPLGKEILDTRMDRFEQVVLEHIDNQITARITTLSNRVGSLDKKIEIIRKIIDKKYAALKDGEK
jgi:hypothetical protein